MNEEALREAAAKLLASSGLGDEEVTARLRQARDPEYWRGLCPGLPIEGGGPVWLEDAPLVPAERDLEADLARQGYFRTEPFFSEEVILRMRGAVDELRRQGWPQTFTFVYDAFWAAFRAPAFVRLLSVLLGPGFRQDAAVWTYFVPTTTGARGWPPHADNNPGRLTVWIPLTDATLENGCMYVIPKDRLAATLDRRFPDVGSVTIPQLGALLQAARALPARAGSILTWDQDLVHWGSISNDAAWPRISIAADFAPRQGPPRNDLLPPMEMDVLPSFAQRLRIVGRMIPYYQGFEHTMIRYNELGRRLAEGPLAD
jgi:hypothetical protein